MVGSRYSFFKIAKSAHAFYDSLKWRMVSYLMRNFSLSRKESIDIDETFRLDSDVRIHNGSVFFKIIFPGVNKYEIIDGALV